MVKLEYARWAYVVLAFVQAGLTAGVIFGWTELETVFVREHVYADHCAKDDTKVPCKAQTLFFNMVYTVGVFSNNAAPLLTGIFLDKFGPKLTSLLSVVIFMGGCGLFTIPNSQAYAPAFALLGFSGPGIYVAIMHLNNLFPGYQATVLSFFSGTFTVSNFVFKVFRILNQQKGWFSLAHLFGCYIVILFPVFLVGGIFWPNKPFELLKKKSDPYAYEKGDTEPLVPKEEKVNPLYGAGLKEQITAPELWLIIAWMATSNLHIASYLGTVSNQYPANYVSIFNWIWEFGFVAIPFFGIILDKFGIIFAIFVSNVGLFLFSIVTVIPVLEVQYVGFVLVSTVNVGVWGIFYTFLAKTFGFNNYGKLLGVACASIAIVGLLQYPFLYATLDLFDGKFVYVNSLFTVMQFFAFATPYFLMRRDKAKRNINYRYSAPINEETLGKT